MAADPSAGRMPEDAEWRVAGHSTPRRARILLTLAVTVTVIAATACTARVAPGPTGSGGTPAMSGSGAAGGAVTGDASVGDGSAIPAADLAAIRTTIDAINATAGGQVSVQRAELDTLAAPDELAKQRSCPAAHSTLQFQPAYQDLRLAPEGAAGIGAGPSTADAIGPPSARVAPPTTTTTGAAGTAYLLPAFITIYTGDRITGTDLTTLRLWVVDGTARTGALCVS